MGEQTRGIHSPGIQQGRFKLIGQWNPISRRLEPAHLRQLRPGIT